MKRFLLVLLTAFPCMSTAATFDITFEKFGLYDGIYGDGTTVDRYLTSNIQVEIDHADNGGYNLSLDPEQDFSFPFFYQSTNNSILTTETHYLPGQSTRPSFSAEIDASNSGRNPSGTVTRHSLSFSAGAFERFLSLGNGQQFETDARFSAYDLYYTQRNFDDAQLDGTGRVTVRALSPALIAPVPLPNSAVLVMLGLASLLGLRRARS